MAKREAHGKLKLSLTSEEASGQGVGATLREARLRRGWTIDDCAQTLRIRAVVLTAMEAGRFERLPNGAYALGFVRSYADFLGLDRDEIVRRVKNEAAALSTKTELVFPTPISEGRLPSGLILLVSAVLAAGAYGIWYYNTAGERQPIPRVAAVPQQVTAPAPAPAPVPAAPEPPAAQAAPSAPTPAPVDTVASAPAEASLAPPVADTAPASAPPTPPQVAAAPPPSAPATPAVSGAAAAAASVADPTNSAAPRQYGESGDSRIVIKATGDSWVQVRDPSGAVVFSRILRAGESYSAPNQSGFLLATGSAGMLDIMVDGKKAPAIGRPGFVRKDVPLDPEKLLAGTAVPPEVVRPASSGSSEPAPVAPAATADRPAGG